MDRQTIWICGCGLSKNKPTCDGSHKKTRDEAPGSVYLYDAQSRVKAPTETKVYPLKMPVTG